MSTARNRPFARWRRFTGLMADLAYIGLTIAIFAVLFLLVKGVERFER